MYDSEHPVLGFRRFKVMQPRKYVPDYGLVGSWRQVEWPAGEVMVAECKAFGGAGDYNSPCSKGGPVAQSKGCKCVVPETEVYADGDIKRGYKAWYTGPLVRIKTLRGNNLTVTPNHPVLTTHGWVSAGDLRKGAYVLSSTVEGGVEVAGRNVYDVPTRIETLFNSLSPLGKTSSIGVRGGEFHNDGRFMQGEIDITTVDESLGIMGQSVATQNLRELNLSRAKPPLPALASIGAGAPNGNAASSQAIPKRPVANAEFGGELADRLASLVAPDMGFGDIQLEIRSGADFNSGFFKTPPYNHVVDPEILSDSLGALSSFVPSDDFSDTLVGNVAAGTPDTTYLDTPSDERFSERGNATSSVGTETVKGLPGFVAPDEVIEVRNVRNAGTHVYDLQTSNSRYFASNIILHNCGCHIFYSLSDAQSYSYTTGPGGYVIAIARGGGKVLFDERFARCSQAEVVALIDPAEYGPHKHIRGNPDKGFIEYDRTEDIREWVSHAAERYGVPMMGLFDAMAYANEKGVWVDGLEDEDDETIVVKGVD